MSTTKKWDSVISTDDFERLQASGLIETSFNAGFAGSYNATGFFGLDEYAANRVRRGIESRGGQWHFDEFNAFLPAGEIRILRVTLPNE